LCTEYVVVNIIVLLRFKTFSLVVERIYRLAFYFELKHRLS
jgi:hypothetical protein